MGCWKMKGNIMERENIMGKFSELLLGVLKDKNYTLPDWAYTDKGDKLSHPISEWEKVTSVRERVVDYYDDLMIQTTVRGETNTGDETYLQITCSSLAELLWVENL